MSVTDFTRARARPRIKLFQPTTLRVRAETVRAHLLDLSATGALVHTAIPPAPGARVGVGVDGVVHAARVVWTSGRRFGIVFLTPLSDPEVAAPVASRQAEVAIASARIGPLCR